MKRIAFLLALGVVAALPRGAGALDTVWQTDANANGHRLFGLAAPTLGTGVLRLQDATPGSCILQATGVNGSIICSTLTGFTASPPLLLTGSTLSLSLDGSLGVSGGNLQRSALTGAITAGAGSNVTAFGTQAALSIFGVAGNSTAVPAPVVATIPLSVPTLNSAGTAWSWAVPTPLTTGVVATWPVTKAAVFCLDGIVGNDGNAGVAISADLTSAGLAAATSSCSPKRTLAAEVAIVPFGAGNRQAQFVVRGDATTYADALDLLNFIGSTYRSFNVRATGTNATAGATAFAGDLNDLTFLGAKTGTGMNAAGYTPVSSTTSNVMQLVKVGGGSPAFAAEPGKPLFLRLRGDISDPTTADRNKVIPIVEVTSADTIRLDNNYTWTTGDTFYIEEPGATFTGSATFSNLVASFRGVAVTGTWFATRSAISATFIGAGSSMSLAYNSSFSFGTTYSVGTTTATGGPSLVTGALFATGGALSAGAASLGVTSTATLTSLSTVAYAGDNVIGTNLAVVGGMESGNAFVFSNFIGGSGSAARTPANPLRVLGTMTIEGAKIDLEAISLPSTSQAFGVVVQGACDINLRQVLSGGAKTNAGWDVSASYGSRVSAASPTLSSFAPTLTGANGDLFIGTNTEATPGSIYTTYAGLSGLGTVIFPNGDKWSFNGGAANATTLVNTRAVIATAAGNGSGSTILGGMLIRSGGPGDTLSIQPLLADNAADSNGAIGYLISDIPNGKGGLVVWNGVVPVQWEYLHGSGGGPGVGGDPAYVSSVYTGWVNNVPPPAGAIVRFAGWAVDENFIDLTADNQQIQNQITMNGASVLTAERTQRADGTTIVWSHDGTNHWNSLSVGTVPSGSISGLAAIATSGSAADLIAGTLPGARFPALTGPVTTSAGSLATALNLAGGSVSGALPCASVPTFTGDVTNSACALTLANIPNDTPMAGDLLATAIAAPGTPASGKGRIYVDSTSKNIALKNDAGTINHGAQTYSCASHTWANSFSNAGATSCTQPDATDLTGLATVATSGSASDLGTGTLPDARLSNVVTAGSCTSCDITYDAHGRITVAASGGGGGGTVTSVSGTSGRISSTGGTTPVIDLVNTAVTPGSYTYASLTVDAAGRLTAASNGTTPAPVGATYITQTPDATLTSEQALSALATGILKNTTTTGVLTIAAAGTDYQAPGNYITALTGDGTASGPGSAAFTIAANAVTFAKTQTIAANSLWMNATGSTAVASAVSLGSTSGVLEYVNGSPDTFAAFASGSQRIPFGSGTSGQFSDSANLKYDGSSINIASAGTNTVTFPFFGTLSAGDSFNMNAIGVNQGIVKQGGGSLYIGTLASGDIVYFTAGVGVMDIDATQRFNWGGSVEHAAGLTMQEWINTPPSTASAASLTAVHDFRHITVTLTGTTHNTSSNGYVYIEAPTVTDASAVTIDDMPTLGISGGPIQAGSATITLAPALELFTGALQIDALNAGGMLRTDTHGDVLLTTLGGGLALTSGTLDLTVNGTTSTMFTGYIKQILLNPYDQVIGATTVTGAPATTYKWSGSFTNSSFGIFSNTGTVLVPGDNPLTTSDNLNVTPGGTIPQAMQAAWGTSSAKTAYVVPRTYASGTWWPDIGYIACTGSGNATVELSLWESSDMTTTGSYTQLASVSTTIAAGVSGFQAFSAQTWSTSVPSGNHVFMAVRRTDSNSGAVVQPINYTGTAEFVQ